MHLDAGRWSVSKRRGWLLLGVAWLVLIIGLFWTGYDGRVEQRTQSIAACHRGQLDRAANAAGWWAAYEHAKAEGGRQKQAVEFRSIAASLNHRLSPAHSLKVNGRYPLGFGVVVCEKVFPRPSVLPFGLTDSP